MKIEPHKRRLHASARGAVYKAIVARRDVRRFVSSPLPGDAVERIVLAARITRRPSVLCNPGISY
jgi:hypothetical protein